jgi:replicative DNA helicase
MSEGIEEGAQEEAPEPAELVPPVDLDAEGIAIAYAFEHGTRGELAELEPRHFYATANLLIYSAIRGCEERGEPPEVHVVARELRRRGHYAKIGGGTYLATLAQYTPLYAHVAVHSDALRELWRKRVLIEACSTLAVELHGELDAAQAWARLRQICLDVGERHDGAELP